MHDARNACTLGRCKYADPTTAPNHAAGVLGCDGYHTTEYHDANGRVTIRWYRCPRHRAWWKLERIRRSAPSGAAGA